MDLKNRKDKANDEEDAGKMRGHKRVKQSCLSMYELPIAKKYMNIFQMILQEI